MFGELSVETEHDFLIWKVKQRAVNDKPKPACSCIGDSVLKSTGV